MNHAYEWSLRLVLRLRFATLLVAFALLGASVWLFMDMPKGFLPSTDSGILNGISLAGQDISYDSMVEHVRAVKNIASTTPIPRAFSHSSAEGIRGMRVPDVEDRKDRKLSADQVLQELQPKLLSVPGIVAFLQNPPPIQIGGNNTQSPYQLTLAGCGPGRDLSLGADSGRQDSHSARLHERHQRPADCAVRRSMWISTATAHRPSG